MSYPRRTAVPDEFRQTEQKATQPQIDFVSSLFEKRDLFKWNDWFDATNAMDHEEYAAYKEHYLTVQVPAMSKTTVSKLITFLKALPWAPRTPAAAPVRTGNEPATTVATTHQPSSKVFVDYTEVETDSGTKRFGKLVLAYEPGAKNVLKGSYGIDTSDWDEMKNDFSFFKVWVGDRGGWDVRLYVSDDTGRVRLGYETKLKALSAIAVDPEAASRAFGMEFGKCGVCGRGLTNDESRALGIGPVCRENVGRY